MGKMKVGYMLNEETVKRLRIYAAKNDYNSKQLGEIIDEAINLYIDIKEKKPSE